MHHLTPLDCDAIAGGLTVETRATPKHIILDPDFWPGMPYPGPRLESA